MGTGEETSSRQSAAMTAPPLSTLAFYVLCSPLALVSLTHIHIRMHARRAAAGWLAGCSFPGAERAASTLSLSLSTGVAGVYGGAAACRQGG